LFSLEHLLGFSREAVRLWQCSREVQFKRRLCDLEPTQLIVNTFRISNYTACANDLVLAGIYVLAFCVSCGSVKD